jgi:putative CocE/NonD family hydrolase
MKWDRDVMVRMRDGVHVCIDVYRPDDPGKFPALLAFCAWNKDLQTPDATENNGPQPAWSPFWFGGQEAGDSRFLTSRGYAHIIGNPRGVGKSEDSPAGTPPMAPNMDFYDLIEWIAVQPWCDGNVGMIGISAFAGAQWQAAMQQPPHLKAIFPYDACPANWFRDYNPGGVLQIMSIFIGATSVAHETIGRPVPLPLEMEKLWEEAMKNPDYRMYGNLYNILTMKGQRDKATFASLINPYEAEEAVKITEDNFKKIKLPTYTGGGWYDYTYKMHLEGCQSWWDGIKVPKKLLFTGLAHLERPFHSIHSEILRWYDYWLKGINTGIMDEPPVKMWVMGANVWYEADNWPVPETKWTKYYLQSWERLREEPFLPSSRDGIEQPDAFVQMPPSQTRQIQKLRYMTDPLPEDMLIAGPSALYIHASIDQPDTNWIVILKDVGPDESIRTAREGETMLHTDLPERELIRGWLKASHRALDSKKSKPWKPWHPFTRKASKPVVPGEINEYAIEILSTANLFKKGHRICLEITSVDIPTGSAGLTNVEYIPYHVCSSNTVVHKIYHNEKYPSYLLLPVIPRDSLK